LGLPNNGDGVVVGWVESYLEAALCMCDGGEEEEEQSNGLKIENWKLKIENLQSGRGQRAFAVESNEAHGNASNR
jgi:hypothetical protein